jgi:mannosyltransferase
MRVRGGLALPGLLLRDAADMQRLLWRAFYGILLQPWQSNVAFLGYPLQSAGVVRNRLISLILPCLIISVAYGLRLYCLDGQSLWFDEGFALHLASQSLPQIIQRNPVGWLPLHSVALHFWLEFVGQSPFAARFFSVFFGVLVVALLYLLGRSLATPRMGTIASVVGTTSPFLIYYSQEARTYALWLFLSLLSVCLLLRVLRHPGRVRGWLLYTGVTTLALYTHYFSVFLLPWGAMALFHEAVRSRRWKLLLCGAAGQLCALVLSVPLITFARTSAVDRYGFWRSPLSPLQVVVDLWYNLTTGGNLPFDQALPVMGIMAVLAITGLVLFRPVWNGVLIASYFLIPILGMLALSMWRELYVARYLAIAVPGAYLLVAQGFDRLWAVPAARPRFLRVGGSLLALCSVVVVGWSWYQGLRNYYYSPQYARDDFRSAAQFISARESEKDVLVMSGGGIFTAFLPYYEGHLPWMDLPPFGEWLDEVQVVEDLNSLLAGRVGGRVWLVLSDNQITDPQNLIVAHLWTYGHVVQAETFPGRTGVRVLVFHPREESETFTFAPIEYEPLRANFDNKVELLGFEIDDWHFKPTGDIHLALQWQALTHLEEDYHAFVHLLDDREQVVAAHDKVPLNNYFRPKAWQVGEPLRDEYVLSLPHNLSAGTYTLELGLYSYPDLKRLTVVEADQSQRDRVLLPPIIVNR